MSNNSSKTNSSESKGFFGALTSAVTSAVGASNKNATASANANSKKANNAKNKPEAAVPVTAGVNAPTEAGPMKGGVASTRFSTPENMRQPSEAVMEWATTADAPLPPASQMRDVAHGGTRRNRRDRNRRSGGTRRNRRDRNRRSGGTRRNRRDRNRRSGGTRRNRRDRNRRSGGTRRNRRN
jgi:hypothetical protein